MSMTVKLNSGQVLTGLPDYKVGDLVARNLPPDTFSSVHVVTELRRFSGTTVEVTSRKISLEISKLSLGWNCFEGFLKAILLPVSTTNAPNQQLILDQLTGASTPAGLDEVKKAFKECYTITLFISDDCNFCELQLSQSQHYVIARRTGEFVAFVIKTGVPVLSAMSGK
jgi:hypothetical protein